VEEKTRGGFSFLTAHQLLLVMWGRQTGLVTAFEFRVWFAAVEIAKRREGCRGPFRFDHQGEWSKLLGGVRWEKTVRALRKLTRAGLLSWSPESLLLATSPDQVQNDLASYFELFERCGKATRRRCAVPVPRSIIRLLAKPTGKGMAALIVGALLRLVWRKREDGRYVTRSGGLLSASWVAKTFGVGLATVKHAIGELVECGLLKRLDTPHWAKQGRGARTVLDLAWQEAREEAAEVVASKLREAKSTEDETAGVIHRPCPEPGPISTLRNLAPGPVSTPLESYEDPFQVHIHQDPAAPRPNATGACAGRDRRQRKPNILDVRPEDLTDARRGEQLFEDFRKRGRRLYSDGKPRALSRQTFFALIERARRIQGDSVRVFMGLIRGEHFDFASIDDDEQARRRLLKLDGLMPREPEDGLAAGTRSSSGPRRTRPRPELSKDALLVATLRRKMPGQDAFALFIGELRKLDPSWSLERWKNAELELGRAQDEIVKAWAA
jgi:hypothetical protein